MQPSKGAQAPLVPNFIHANQHKLTLIKTHKINHRLLSELLLLNSTKCNWVHYLPPSQDAFQTSNVCTYAHIYEQVSKTPVIQARRQIGTYLGMLCVFKQWNLNSVTVPVGHPTWLAPLRSAAEAVLTCQKSRHQPTGTHRTADSPAACCFSLTAETPSMINLTIISCFF